MRLDSTQTVSRQLRRNFDTLIPTHFLDDAKQAFQRTIQQHSVNGYEMTIIPDGGKQPVHVGVTQEDTTRTANDAADSNAAAANDASAPASDASAPASATPASDEEILNHTIGRLIDEGVPKARASEIAGATLKRIKNRLAEAYSLRLIIEIM